VWVIIPYTLPSHGITSIGKSIFLTVANTSTPTASIEVRTSRRACKPSSARGPQRPLTAQLRTRRSKHTGTPQRPGLCNNLDRTRVARVRNTVSPIQLISPLRNGCQSSGILLGSISPIPGIPLKCTIYAFEYSLRRSLVSEGLGTYGDSRGALRSPCNQIYSAILPIRSPQFHAGQSHRFERCFS